MKKSPQRDDVDIPASYPCGPRLEELAEAAIRFLNEHTTLVPVLWGPSSEGKTFFCRNLAKKMDALFIHVILKSMKPDDVAGCQIMTPEGELRVALPWWFRQAKEAAREGRRVVILIDELDKSDPDLFAPILTFLRDRTCYNVPLEDEEAVRERRSPRLVYLVGACNPGAFDVTLRRRLAFIWWPGDIWGYHRVAQESFLARLAVEEAAPELSGRRRRDEEEPPPSPEFTRATVDALRRGEAALLRMDRETRNFILSLLMPPALAGKVARRLEEMSRPHEQLDYLLSHPREAAQLLGRLPVPEFVATGVSLISHAIASGQEERLPEAVVAIFQGALAPLVDNGHGAGRQEALERLRAWLAPRPEKEELRRLLEDALLRLGAEPFFEKAQQEGLIILDGAQIRGGLLLEALESLMNTAGAGQP
jgi:hypothetical protein